MFTPIPNHVAQALDRLITEYKNATNFRNLITALVGPIQDIEDMWTDMNTLRYLPSATGIQLDHIGSIVGLPRPAGMSDAQYILELYGQIKINTSDGQPEQAIQAFQLFTSAALILLDEDFPGEVLLESDYHFPDQASVQNLLHLMGEVLPAGVRCDGFIEFDPTNAFSFDGSLPGSGFGDSGDPSVGGLWPDLRLDETPFAFAGDDPTPNGFGSSDDPLVGGVWVAPQEAPFFNSAQVPSAGDKVIVQLVAAGLPPLLPQSPYTVSGSLQITGFIVKVNAVAVAISDAVLQYNTQVFLTLASVVHAGDTVTVEYSPGNVVDSQGLALAAFAAKPVTNNSTM